MASENNERIVEAKPSEHRAWYNWGYGLGNWAERLWDDGKHEEARSRYEDAFSRYERTVEIKPGKHEAWYNWGTDLGNWAERLWDDGKHEEARSRYEDAFSRYERAVEIKPDKHEAWCNWGYDLGEWAERLQVAQREEDAHTALNKAADKLHMARSHSDDARTSVVLAKVLAARRDPEDVAEAARHLRSGLQKEAGFASSAAKEDVFRRVPELKEIIDDVAEEPAARPEESNGHTRS